MGLFGNFFGGSSAPNYNVANGYLGNLQSIGTNYGVTANQLNNTYNGDQAQSQQALNGLSQYLQSNPATQSYNAANLDTNLASRGISPNSSMGIGGLASINRGLAANDANIQSQVGQNNIAQHAANLGQLANLWGGAANTAFGQNQDVNGARAGIYGNLAANATNQANALYDYQQQQNAGVGSFLGALGTGASMIPGIGTVGSVAAGTLSR